MTFNSSVKKLWNSPWPKRFEIETMWLRKLFVYVFLFGGFFIGYILFWGSIPRYLPDGSLNGWYFVLLPLMLLSVLIIFFILYCFVGYVEKFFLKRTKTKK